jgi:hypothetical protein
MVSFLLTACGGGGGGGSSSGGSSASTSGGSSSSSSTSSSGGSTGPLISGFNFSLEQGDFWEYGWNQHGSSYAQGSSGSSWDYGGEFRIVLGAPVTIDGMTAYPMEFSGQAHTHDVEIAKDRWTHIAVAGNKVYASADGLTLTEVFDAQDGTLLGSGFFQPLDPGMLYAVESATIDNIYLSEPAYQLEASAAEGQCEYFPEVGQTICGGDMQISYTEREFFQPGIGPVGYYYYNAYDSCGGGFCSGSNDTLDIGLTASSFWGDVPDYELEHEPNNAPAQANIISLPIAIRGGFYYEDHYGPTVTVGIPPTPEAEPNNTSTAPQTIPVTALVTGNVLAGEHGENFTVPNFPTSGQTYSEQVEDWFLISPAAAMNLNVRLDFSGNVSPADFDLWIIRVAGTQIIAYSLTDNLQSGVQTEAVNNVAVTAGQYYVLVDGYNTNGARANYTLSVSPAGTQTLFTPTDWYVFELNSQYHVSVVATGGAGLVLINVTTDQVVTSSMPSGFGAATNLNTDLLEPGSYRLGVIYEDGLARNNYELTIDQY